MRRDDDNPIDWSAFDETAAQDPGVPGSRLYAILALLLFVLAALGLIRGGIGLHGAFAALAADDGSGSLVSAAVQASFCKSSITLALSLATLVPAGYALGATNSKSGFLGNLLLVACGIVCSVLAFALGVALSAKSVDPAQAVSAVDPLWALFAVLVAAYLVVSILVALSSRARGGAHSAAENKEALWDEQEIWKQ